MDHFEKFEEQLISSYKSTLAVEGEEICKEVESLNQDDYDLLIDKARAYCLFCTNPKRSDIDKNLFDKCKKYLFDECNLRYIKNNVNIYLNQERNKKRFKD